VMAKSTEGNIIGGQLLKEPKRVLDLFFKIQTGSWWFSHCSGASISAIYIPSCGFSCYFAW